MIYVVFTFLFYPLLYFLSSLKKKQSFKNILIIQTSKIGDMIYSTSVFREIKKKSPEIILTVMANSVTQDLLKNNPNVDNIISLNMKDIKGFSGKIKLIKLLSKGRYDISLSLNPNIPFTVTPLWALIPVRVAIIPNFCGRTLRVASFFNTYNARHKTGKLILETYNDQLQFIGIKTKALATEVYSSPDAEKKVTEFLSGFSKDSGNYLIGIAVSSGNKLKELGVNTIASLSRQLINELSASVVLIGSEKDKDTAREILKATDKIIDSIGVFTLSELPALLKRLSLFIGVDTGVTYMADALSIPLIDIAGPSDMSDQRPLGSKSTIIQKDVSCIPCSHAFNAPYSCKRGDRMCIVPLSISEIVETVKKLLPPTP